MKPITREGPLTPEDVAKYKAIREPVAEELPELIERHHERMAILDQVQELFQQLKVWLWFSSLGTGRLERCPLGAITGTEKDTPPQDQ